MYYSDEILEEVRSRNDILDVISAHVKLKRSGNTYFGLCPFHNEKTGSFSVTPSKQMFYCFGCHKGGSVITFVELYENYSFTEAVKALADRAGIALPQEDMSKEEKQKKDFRTRLFEIQKLAGTYYYYNLRSKSGTIGMQYLKGRGLSDETMKSFGLGYAGQYSGALAGFLRSKGFSDDLLIASGLMQADEKRGMYDKFWNRVMFPIMDVNNRIIGFGGRVMGDGKPKYLNSPETEIFNKRRNLYGLNVARKTRERFLILCEGYMDVITMHQAGFTNAVASLGTALTQEHAALLRRYTEEVVLSYDSDTAGVDAALRAIPMLRENGITVKVLNLSPYKDPDEFIKNEGNEKLAERLSDALNAFLFEIDVLCRSFNHNDPDERTRFQKKAAEKIAQFELEAQRENYISAVAQRYNIGFEALRQMVNKSLAAGLYTRQKTDLPSGRTKQTGSSEEDISQSLLLTWLTMYPGFYPILKEYLSPEDFREGVYRSAAKLLYAQLESGTLSEASIIDHFSDPSDQALAASFFHAQLPVRSSDDLRKAMKETIKKVCNQAGASSDPALSSENALSSMQKMVERKRKLEKLNHLNIELDEDPLLDDPGN